MRSRPVWRWLRATERERQREKTVVQYRCKWHGTWYPFKEIKFLPPLLRNKDLKVPLIWKKTRHQTVGEKSFSLWKIEPNHLWPPNTTVYNVNRKMVERSGGIPGKVFSLLLLGYVKNLCNFFLLIWSVRIEGKENIKILLFINWAVFRIIYDFGIREGKFEIRCNWWIFRFLFHFDLMQKSQKSKVGPRILFITFLFFSSTLFYVLFSW